MPNLFDSKKITSSVKRRMMGDNPEDQNPKSTKKPRRGSRGKSIPLPHPGTLLEATGNEASVSKKPLEQNESPAVTPSIHEKSPTEGDISLEPKNPPLDQSTTVPPSYPARSPTEDDKSLELKNPPLAQNESTAVPPSNPVMSPTEGD